MPRSFTDYCLPQYFSSFASMRAVLLLCSLSFLFHVEFRPIYFQLSQLVNLDFPVAQMVKILPAIQETRVRSLSWEVPLVKGIAIHSSILAWRIPFTEKPGGLQSKGSQRVGHNWATNTQNTWPLLSIHTTPGLRQTGLMSSRALHLFWTLIYLERRHCFWENVSCRLSKNKTHLNSKKKKTNKKNTSQL